MRVAKRAEAPVACAACAQRLPARAFSRSQLGKELPKCKDCVQQALGLLEADAPRTKRCAQCFRDLPRELFSKRQYHQIEGKCVACVDELEKAASASTVPSKWSYGRFYRVSHRGKSGGVSVRVKCNIAAPLAGYIPLGRVFRATDPIYNEQGDPMVKIETLSSAAIVAAPTAKTEDSDSIAATSNKYRDGWIPCRSLRNEVLIEPHHGPFKSPTNPRFYRCVVEGCKARVSPDLELSEIGYVLYGDVVEVVEAVVTDDGIVFLQLHPRYFDGPAWVVERTLDNESVLNRVEGPSKTTEQYRCVQESGAPLRLEPSLSSPPVGRIPCGTVVTVVERVVTPERQVFLRLPTNANPHVAIVSSKAPDGAVTDTQDLDVWVIETSTGCASVMIKCASPFNDTE